LANSLRRSRKRLLKATTLKSNFAPAHYQLALVYEREGKFDQAITKLASVEKYNPSDVGVGFELGTLYVKRSGSGDLEKARVVFEHVVELAPSYSDAHWLLGSVYEKLNLRDLAIKHIEIVAN
jgi:tetratricopeptide (TPR) repeat protein